MKNKSARLMVAAAFCAAMAVWISSSAFGAVGFSTNLVANGMTWNYGYEGGEYPTNGFGAGNYFAEDLQGAGGTVTVTTDGLEIDTGYPGQDGMGFRLNGPSTVLPATNVWTVEYRMRMLDGHPFNSSYGVEFRTGSDAAGFVARASQNAVHLTGTSTISSNLALSTDWHTYRVVSFGGTSTLYVDDLVNPVLSIASYTSANRWLEFGDYGAPSGSVEYDYIRWATAVPVPEPSVLLLLSVAAVIVHRRKCQRTT